MCRPKSGGVEDMITGTVRGRVTTQEWKAGRPEGALELFNLFSFGVAAPALGYHHLTLSMLVV